MRPFARGHVAPEHSRFNLRREAAPHATASNKWYAQGLWLFQSQTRSRSTCDYSRAVVGDRLLIVSISDEKPLHMRRPFLLTARAPFDVFQSQTRSRSTCDVGTSNVGDGDLELFQSQTRSRSTCDAREGKTEQ